MGEVLWHLIEPTDNWDHLKETVLGKYLKGSLILVLGTLSLSVFAGVSCAWLVACCEFPGRRLFEWALILPLTIPTFIAAYAYFDLLDNLTPVLIWVRLNSSPEAMMKLSECLKYIITIMILASVLYPYIYLMTRSAFSRQSNQYLEASRTLGHNPLTTFWRIALPMARPAIIAGASLVVMETLSDYGAVKHFNIPTFTTGIFRTWTGLGDLPGAMRLAAYLMLFVLIILLAEKRLRSEARYHENTSSNRPFQRYPLGKLKSTLAILCCCFPLLIGFIIPVTRLGLWARTAIENNFNQSHFIKLALNSVGLAITASLVTVITAFFLVFVARYFNSKIINNSNRLAILGYSVPGVVIGMGIIYFQGPISKNFNILITSSLLTLIFAYLVRYIAVAWQSIDSGMEKNCNNLNEASKSLGSSPLKSLFWVNIPLLWNSVIIAGLLVLIDVIKELPLTLILSPFNFETLSTQTFKLAQQSQIPESSIPALCIIISILAPVIWLNSKMKSEK